MNAAARVVPVVVEGAVDAAVAARLFAYCGLQMGKVYGKNGKAWIRDHVNAYNQAARYSPWFVLVDLDRDADCAPPLVKSWLPRTAQLMIFRVAVREVESWLFADAQRLAQFLGVSAARVPAPPEETEEPKQMMVSLARGSRNQAMQKDMVPRPGSGRQVGPAYSSRLVEFVSDRERGWRPEVAVRYSESLRRCIRALNHIAVSKRSSL